MDDIEFIDRKIAKCKSARNRARLESVLEKLYALESLKRHITMTRRIEYSDGSEWAGCDSVSIEAHASFLTRKLHSELEWAAAQSVKRWIANSFSREEMERIYDIKEEISGYEGKR